MAGLILDAKRVLNAATNLHYRIAGGDNDDVDSGTDDLVQAARIAIARKSETMTVSLAEYKQIKSYYDAER